MESAIETNTSATPRFWRSVGAWMAALIGVAQLINAISALADPMGFSVRPGLPVGEVADTGFVLIYALRTGFIAILVAALLWTRNYTALRVVSAVAIIMPMGDAYLTFHAGAPVATVGRHLAYVIYIIVMTGFLHAWIVKYNPAR
jgi:hypothetical protein